MMILIFVSKRSESSAICRTGADLLGVYVRVYSAKRAMSDERRREKMIENEDPTESWLMKTLGCVAPVASRQSPEILSCSSTFRRFVLMDRRHRASFMICNGKRSKSSSSFLSSSFQRGSQPGQREVYMQSARRNVDHGYQAENRVPTIDNHR
jgi:hypothetical protein